MKAFVLLLLLLCNTLPSFVVAQTTQTANQPKAETQLAMPVKDAYIVRFYATSEGEGPKTDKAFGPGPLSIIYSDGTLVEIPNEKGRFGEGDQLLTQENFLDIQLADDRRHLGWLADYMICQQSYACPAELVIYQSGHKLRYISPATGIMWRWKFLKGGKQVVVQFGFPHGDDTGAYELYDTNTGRRIAKFFSSTKKKTPPWVQQLQSSTK